jgi:hypothetical protein
LRLAAVVLRRVALRLVVVLRLVALALRAVPVEREAVPVEREAVLRDVLRAAVLRCEVERRRLVVVLFLVVSAMVAGSSL